MILGAGCSLLDIGYSILDTRYWILDAGCSMIVAGYRRINGERNLARGKRCSAFGARFREEKVEEFDWVDWNRLPILLLKRQYLNMDCYDLNVVFTAESQRAQSPYIFHLPVTCLAIA